MKLMEYLRFTPGSYGRECFYIEWIRKDELETLHVALLPPGASHHQSGLIPSFEKMTADRLLASLCLQGMEARFRCVDTVQELEEALLDSMTRIPAGSATEFQLVGRYRSTPFSVPPGFDASPYENGKIVESLVKQLPVAYVFGGRHDESGAETGSSVLKEET